MTDTAGQLAALSKWVDDGQGDRDPEAITWGRLAKITEECGEVIEAFIGITGQNPRKGVHGSRADVHKELLDVAVTALAAAEHWTGNRGESMADFAAHVDALCVRAGLAGSDE